MIKRNIIYAADGTLLKANHKLPCYPEEDAVGWFHTLGLVPQPDDS